LYYIVDCVRFIVVNNSEGIIKFAIIITVLVNIEIFSFENIIYLIVITNDSDFYDMSYFLFDQFFHA
jgi:hypothetical protein